MSHEETFLGNLASPTPMHRLWRSPRRSMRQRAHRSRQPRCQASCNLATGTCKRSVRTYEKLSWTSLKAIKLLSTHTNSLSFFSSKQLKVWSNLSQPHMQEQTQKAAGPSKTSHPNRLKQLLAKLWACPWQSARHIPMFPPWLKPIQGADWYPWLHILVHRHHMLANGLESAGNVGCESNWPWIRMSSKVTHELPWFSCDENNQHGKRFATIACRSTWNQSSNQIKPRLLTFQTKDVFKVNIVPFDSLRKAMRKHVI